MCPVVPPHHHLQCMAPALTPAHPIPAPNSPAHAEQQKLPGRSSCSTWGKSGPLLLDAASPFLLQLPRAHAQVAPLDAPEAAVMAAERHFRAAWPWASGSCHKKGPTTVKGRGCFPLHWAAASTLPPPYLFCPFLVKMGVINAHYKN